MPRIGQAAQAAHKSVEAAISTQIGGAVESEPGNRRGNPDASARSIAPPLASARPRRAIKDQSGVVTPRDLDDLKGLDVYPADHGMIDPQ